MRLLGNSSKIENILFDGIVLIVNQPAPTLMQTLLFLAEDTTQYSTSGIVTILVICLVALYVIGGGYRDIKHDSFKTDFNDFYPEEEVAQWHHCAAIVKRGEKKFVRISKNAQGLFQEEPYPVFAEEQPGHAISSEPSPQSI